MMASQSNRRTRLRQLRRLPTTPRATLRSTPQRWLVHLYRSVRGNISVEFALVLPFLLLLVMGAYDFGRGFTEKLRLNSAARAGTQYALANYNMVGDDDGVIQSARADAEDVDGTLTVTPHYYCSCLTGGEIACGTGCSGGEVPMRYIEVDVSGPFEFMFDYPMTTGSMTLHGHAELRLR
jgi:TadE-like protein